MLQFLNLVRNYGDKVRTLPTSDNTMIDLNLQFLRLQSQLQDMQRQQDVKDRSSAKMPYPQGPQQKLQMILSAHQQAPQLPPQQSMVQYPPQPYPPGMPFQPPMAAQQRQMTLATNYIIQQNVPSKYAMMHPQQLYYQNVQNIYYNQP